MLVTLTHLYYKDSKDNDNQKLPPCGTIRLERVKGFSPTDIWWELGTYQMEKSMADHQVYG